MRLLHAAIAVFATTFFLAGCAASTSPGQQSSASGGAAGGASASASASPTAAQKALDVCALLNLAAAQTLVGTTLNAGDAGADSNPSCTYNSDPAGPTAQVNVYIGDGAKKAYDIDVALEHSFTDVPGIGDEAHQEDSAIFARKGTTWVAISIVLLDDTGPTVPRLQDAMRTVVGQL